MQSGHVRINAGKCCRTTRYTHTRAASPEEELLTPTPPGPGTPEEELLTTPGAATPQDQLTPPGAAISPERYQSYLLLDCVFCICRLGRYLPILSLWWV